MPAPADLPLLPLAVLAGVLGLAVGSFLNVVVHRVPLGQSVVRPSSACPACGTPIAVRDNVPVAGWLLLRGRARCCGARIPLRYPLVEAGTAALFVAVAAWVGWSWSLPAWLYLAALSVALTLVDVDVHRLPDVLVLPSYPVAAALLVVGAGAAGEWERLPRAAGGALALWALYRGLKLVHPGGMGWGDVKLSGLLGLHLGFVGWGAVVVGAFAAFVLGGVLGLALLAARRATRRSRIPFGPWMILGTWVGAVWGADVASWYLGVTGL